MLGIIISLWGSSITQTITYHNYHYPQAKKEIVVEKEEPAIPEVALEPPIKEKEKDPIACSCVLYAQQFLDLPLNKNAIDLKPNSQPVIGSGILFDYGKNVGHVAIIISYEEDGFLVKESNYKKCEIGTRIVSFSDESIVGFIK